MIFICNFVTVTDVAMFANIFGAALGFLQPTHMVPSTRDMTATGKGLFSLYLSQLVFCVMNLLLVCVFFDEQPPHPPTFAAFHTSKSHYDGGNLPDEGDIQGKDTFVRDNNSDGYGDAPESYIEKVDVQCNKNATISLGASLKILLTNKQTWLLCNGYGLYFALLLFPRCMLKSASEV